MKPLVLKISAFGPYAGETVLDFSALGIQNLFVITGPTGAGKTTIFEAIYYALYGSMSKASRKIDSVRCDFLPLEDTRLTSVSLDFEVNGKVYHIERQPTQKVGRKDGKGIKEEKATAVLSCVDHAQFLPLSKQKEINEKIVEIIGLNGEQFKQIVMLPQGDFQDFLLSNTSDKMELLRNIFGTALYENAQKHIKEQKSALEKKYEGFTEICKLQIENLHFTETSLDHTLLTTETLEEIFRYQKLEEERLKELGVSLQEADQAFERAAQELQQKKDHNARLLQWQEGITQIKALLAQKDGVEDIRQKIEFARKVNFVVPFEEQLDKAKDDCQSLQKHIVEIEQALQALNVQHLQIKISYDEYLAQANQIAILEEKLQLDGQRLEAIKKLEVLKQQIHIFKEHLDKDLKQIQEAEKQKYTLETQLEALANSEKQCNAFKVEQAQLENQQIQYRYALEQRREDYKKITEYENCLTTVVRCKDNIQEAEKAQRLAEEALQHIKEQERAYLAGRLATALEDGMPCPVCGAVHHPLLADTAHTIDDNQREWAEKAMHTAIEKVIAEKTRLDAQQSLLNDLEQWLAEKGYHSHDKCLKDAVMEAGRVDKELVAKANERLDEIKAYLNAHEQDAQAALLLKENVSKSEELLRHLNKEREEHRVAFESAKNQWQHQCEQYHLSGNEDHTVLQLEYEKLQRQLIEYHEEKEKCQEQLETVKLKQTKQKAYFESLNEQYGHAAEQVTNNHIRLAENIETYFGSQENYLAAKKYSDTLEAMQAEVSQYDSKLQKITAQNELLEKQLSIKEPVEIERYQSVYDTADTQAKALRMAYSQQEVHYQNNQKSIQQLEDSMKELGSIAEQYQIVGTLTDVLNGKNEHKIGFEAYVQAYYFEKVLQRANQRLEKMTQGRYYFLRQVDLKDGRRQTGLDIDVMDQYTGRARGVSTLSGGESFKASLALALGLADVVSSENGGVELSTIFIDEGFGTLDEASLDMTIETLMQLQDSGRLVGVISHVSELKERIKARIVVETIDKGSYARFEVKE